MYNLQTAITLRDHSFNRYLRSTSYMAGIGNAVMNMIGEVLVFIEFTFSWGT